MAIRPRSPILPSNQKDPTATDRLVRGAMRNFNRRLRSIRNGYIDALKQIPSEPVVNKRYTFRLDNVLLSALFVQVGVMVDSVLLEGGERDLWFLQAYVEVAYQRGAAQTFMNLGQQSPAYKAGRDNLAALLRSEPYRRRVALIAARQFEEMKGLSGNVKANMGRVLSDGIGRGLNPREIAQNLTEQAGIETSRAHRIARTEIPTALRRARMDEADDAQDTYSITSKQMHISALSPTTRPHHAARNGNLYTTDEMRDWWAQDANSINCKCSVTEVLVDDKGEPLIPSIVERVKRKSKDD